MTFLQWLENSSLAIWVAESLWGYPVLLTLHSIGLAIVVGTITIVNLGILGCYSRLGVAPLGRLLNIAWAGFLINFASGFSLFSAQATYFITHTAFLIKISAIFLALLNAAFLQSCLKETAAVSDTTTAVTTRMRILALSSFFLWLTAITAGRLIAYV